ncbi:DNA-binding protein [Mesorhizobium sp. L48C026A00]|nr:DNA-binding protein [Mesorhizobium sp. L48C026A00]
MANNLTAMVQAIERLGVVFIPENGGGAGVRLAKPGAKEMMEDGNAER